MSKQTSKVFSIFWLIAGLAWIIATIRHVMVKDDTVGTVIYLATAVLSFILAFAYYKNLVKFKSLSR